MKEQREISHSPGGDAGFGVGPAFSAEVAAKMIRKVIDVVEAEGYIVESNEVNIVVYGSGSLRSAVV